MGKMRVIKNRDHDSRTYNGPDLRGLGSDPLLVDSSPYAVLTILQPQKSLTAWLEKYKLTHEHIKDHPTAVHIRCRNHTEGKHKIEALTLAVAALDGDHIGHHGAILHEVKALHHQMHKAIYNVNEAHSPYHVDQVLHQHHWQKEGLTISGVSSFHLHQAGLLSSSSETDRHLSKHDIHRLKAELLQQAQQASSQKKVG